MIEQELEDFEAFYKERLNSQFSKIKKVIKRQTQEIRDNLIEIKVCLDHFLRTGKEKIDQKAQRSLNFFSDRIRKEIDEIEIPEEDKNYDNIIELLSFLINFLFSCFYEVI